MYATQWPYLPYDECSSIMVFVTPLSLFSFPSPFVFVFVVKKKESLLTHYVKKC